MGFKACAVLLFILTVILYHCCISTKTIIVDSIYWTDLGLVFYFPFRFCISFVGINFKEKVTVSLFNKVTVWLIVSSYNSLIKYLFYVLNGYHILVLCTLVTTIQFQQWSLIYKSRILYKSLYCLQLLALPLVLNFGTLILNYEESLVFKLLKRGIYCLPDIWVALNSSI